MTLTTISAILNIAMSAVYIGYGSMTLLDLRKGWRDPTRRRFGIAFLAIMFTCGPHHLEHGLHLLLTDTEGQWAHAAVVALGIPTGLVWFGLRIEALLGGRGDRSLLGTPRWLAALPVLLASYLALTAGAAGRIADNGGFEWLIVPNLLTMVLYLGIGGTLVATQLRNHRELGQWSVSGLALGGVFLTCSLMHLIYASYVSSGDFTADAHIVPIDIAMVPGGAYFLWLVTQVHRGTIGHRADRRRAQTPEREPVTA